jgi:iron complex outermembrane receptor protein
MRLNAGLNLSAATGLALACLSGMAARADAQTAAAASPPPVDPSAAATAGSSSPADQRGLSDIVITAQRRSENLQRAAIAVTAVQSEALVRAGVADATQLTRVAPALQIGTVAGSSNAFYLRGVGNFTTNSLSDAAVSFNIDGVVLSRSIAAQGVFYDLDRIEVLKGPQGTLYGRNATGGAINVITAKPRYGELSGYATAEYGNFDAVKLTGALNVPLGEDGAVRIAGLLSNHDGYYSDGASDDKTRAVRVQAAKQVAPGFKITLGADYAHQGGNGAGSTIYGLPLDDRIGDTDPRAGAIYASSFAFLAGNVLHPLTRNFFNDNTFWGAYAQADVTTPLGTLTILPAYRSAKINQRSYAGSFAYNERLNDDQYSVEVRLASDTENRLSYLLGAYYLSEKAHEHPAYDHQYFAAYGKFLSDTKSYAAFGRLTFKVTDNFRLTGGLRYTADDKSASLDSYNAVVICPAVFAGGNCFGTPELPNTFNPPAVLMMPNGDPIPVQPWGTSGAIVQNVRVVLNPSKTFKKATYRVGFEYDLGPRSLLYGSYETGFKSGGFFSSIDNPVYRPETISAFTLGSKNRFLDNRLQLNVEAFRWEYKGQQVSHFRLNSLGGTEFVTENVGKTRIWGAEVEGRVRASRSTTLNATVQYLHARYKNFTYANPAALGPPVTGCAFAPGAGGVFIVDCSGRRPVNAPDWTVAGGIEQVFDLGGAGRVVFNADGRYQSWSYVGFEELSRQVQKAYFMADLQLRYELPGEHFTVTGFVNNVTDRNVVSFSSPQPRTSAVLAQSLRPPRTFGIRVGYKF